MGSLQRIGRGLTATAVALLPSPAGALLPSRAVPAPAVPLGGRAAQAVTPPLIARARVAVRTARAVAFDTIAPLPGSPRPFPVTYMHAVEVRGVGRDAWDLDERLTDATGRVTLTDILTTPTRTCERDHAPPQPSSWRCHAGQHNPDPLQGPRAAVTWRPLGTRPLFGVAARGYAASYTVKADSLGLLLLHVPVWIDPATARLVVAQEIILDASTGLTRAVGAVRYTRWDDPRLARLIPTVP